MSVCIECNTVFECRRNEKVPKCEEGNHCRCIFCFVKDVNVTRLRTLHIIENCLPISIEDRETLATYCMVIKNARK